VNISYRLLPLLLSLPGLSAAGHGFPEPVPGFDATAVEGPVDRSVRVRTEDGLDLSSFLASRPAAGDADARGEALLGLEARSGLPELPGGATLEYSVAVPEGGDGEAMAEADRRLLRLRLDSQFRDVDCAVRLFSVGDGYARSAPARDHLRAVGLPGAGRGAELSAAWDALDVELRPVVRRLVREEGAARRLEDARSLRVRRALGDELDVAARIETTRARLLGEGDGGVLDDREANRARVELAGTGWRLFWDDATSDRRRTGGGAAESSETTEVGIRLDVPGGLTLAPRYRENSRSSGAGDARLATGLLGVSASLPFAPDLDLEFEYREREEAGADASGIGAELKLRRAFGLAERLPQGFLMDASVSWRESETLGRPLWDDGLAFRLSLEYRRAALR
jgi:hypothetical protein